MVGRYLACVDDQHVEVPFDEFVDEQVAAVLFRILERRAETGTANLSVTVSVMEETTAKKARDDFYAISGIRPTPPTPVPGMTGTVYHWPFDDRRMLTIDRLRGSRIVILEFELPKNVRGSMTNATLRQAFTPAKVVVECL